MPTSPAVMSTPNTLPATGVNLASIAMQSVNATVGLWSELVKNQTSFSLRLLEAMTKTAQSAGSVTSKSLAATPRVEPQVEPPEHFAPVAAIARKKTPTRPSSHEVAAADLPIKRYDALTVQAIVARLGRLHDPAQIRTVMAYEGANKARKGVIAAGEARVNRLRDR